MSVAAKILHLVRPIAANLKCSSKHHAMVRITHSVCRKYSSEAAIPAPTNIDAEKNYADNIQEIVQQIGKLTLLEVADLNELLKKTLKISDAPMAMMPAGMATAAAPEEAEEEVAPVLRLITVKLTGFDPTKKVALIKEIKGLMEGTNLVQAKKLVESLPQTIKADLQKEESEELKTKLEAAGGTVSLVD